MRGPVPSRTRSHHTAWRRCTCHRSQEPSQLPRDLQVPHSHHLSLAQLLGGRHRVRKQACCSPPPPASFPVPCGHPDPAPTSCPRSRTSATQSLHSALGCRRADGQGGQRRAEAMAPGPPHRRGAEARPEKRGVGKDSEGDTGRGHRVTLWEGETHRISGKYRRDV